MNETFTLDEAFKIATDLHNAGRLEEAKVMYFKLIEMLPNEATLYNRLGAIFDAQHQLDKAITLYRKAVDLDKNYASALYNLANAYRDQSQFAESIPYYERALILQPDNEDTLACLHHVYQHVCAWDEYEELTPKVEETTQRALAEKRRTAETPFVHIARCDDQAENLRVANSWAAGIVHNAKKSGLTFDHSTRKQQKKTLTIGYLSKDFQDRPTGHLTRTMFGLHNRENVRVHLYSYGADDGSEYRSKIRQECDKFTDITPLHFTQAAQAIYNDGVDILVDMQGYMGGSRLEIAALHPAPITVSYLGFPGTLGTGICDYIIADTTCITEEQRKNFAEKIAYMPYCYQVNDYQQPIAETDFTRGKFDLPEEGTVFCSFNWSHKLDRTTFATWMDILKSVPDSVLWLWKTSDLAMENLKHEAKACGVKADRLVFANKYQKSKHLARLKLADIALDTRIYGGHTTTTDALYAGVPVITMIGNHFASRVCASLLKNVGLDDLVTDNLEDYKELAIEFGRDPQMIHALKERLRINKGQYPLFNTPQFVRDLEGVYRAMWDAYKG